MENEEIIIDDEEILLINDIDVKITDVNDPEKVTVVKKDPKCDTTSEGDKIVGEGKDVLKSNPKAKEPGQRSWFSI